MYAISESQFQSAAATALKKVFVNNDPFDQPFAPDVAGRKILYEYWYEMEGSLLDAVIAAASEQGDSSLYISILDRPEEEKQRQAYHWHIPFSDISAYRSLVGSLPNVVYSPNGLWGVMGSDEHHGLIGGSENFISKIKGYIPDLDDQVVKFLEAWQYNKLHFDSDVSWLPKLLNHIYKQEVSNDLLRKFNPCEKSII